MSLNRTPIISQQRLNCATFYTFPSAMEDVGLNINERNNKVSFSHYVVLNLPTIKLKPGEMDELKSNMIRLWKVVPEDIINSFLNPNLDVNKWFPTALQDYAMNFETNLRNQDAYDFSSAKTVTERVFWKFMQKIGAIHLNKDENGYYYESTDPEEKDKRVIKGFGYITASSQSSKAHTIDNETYIMIPSSYGQMKYLLKESEDNNYVIGKEYMSTNPENKRGFLEGHADDSDGQFPVDNFQRPFFDVQGEPKYVVRKAHISAPDNAYNLNDDVNDALEMDFNINDLKTVIAGGENVSYDDLAINPEYRLGPNYEFNAILVYYTITDSVGNDIATNLYGIIILDSAQYEGKTQIGAITPSVAATAPMTINSYTKTSSTEKTFGSSYSIRLDIQTASIYDNTEHIITDISTAESSTLTDFNEVVSNLNDCVKIMRNNAMAVANMNTVIQNVKQQTADTSESVKRVEQSVNDILHGNVRDISANDVDTVSIHANEFIPRSYAEDGTVLDVTRIYGNEGDEYGAFDASTFRYNNIRSENIVSDLSSPKMIGITVDGISFDKLEGERVSGDKIGSITLNGETFFEDNLPNYHCNEQQYDLESGDYTPMNDLWSNLVVKKDSNNYLTLTVNGTNIDRYVNIPKLKTSSDELMGNISTKNLISLLIWKINQLEGQINQ